LIGQLNVEPSNRNEYTSQRDNIARPMNSCPRQTFRPRHPKRFKPSRAMMLSAGQKRVNPL
jgi:hypothetical protein